MRAAVGDRIVIASNTLDRPVRVGEVVELRHPDGSPPYLVRWADTEQTGLVFPGPDARVEHAADPAAAEVAPVPTRHVRTWTVEIQLFETDDETTAHAVLRSGMAPPLRGDGHAERQAAEPPVPEIGDEVAAGRALHRLADLLLGAASGDLARVHGHPSALHD
jgi:hypothetical protein